MPGLPGRRRRALRPVVLPGLFAPGGFAEYLKTGARSVIKIDDSLEPTDVAPLADAGLTAYHAIKKALPLLYPGTTCVVIGAGGLGHIGIQCLKAMSATRIVVLDANPDALAMAASWGADETVLVDGDQVAKVQELTKGRGAEVVLDFVGESGAEKWGVEMLKRKGYYFVIGYGGTLEVPTMSIILTEINFIGNLVGSYNDLVELMDLAAQGKVTLHTATYALDDINTAIDDLDSGRLRGRGDPGPLARQVPSSRSRSCGVTGLGRRSPSTATTTTRPVATTRPSSSRSCRTVNEVRPTRSTVTCTVTSRVEAGISCRWSHSVRATSTDPRSEPPWACMKRTRAVSMYARYCTWLT